jgi:hypothetical protein
MNNSYKLNYMNPDYFPGVSGEYQELTELQGSSTNLELVVSIKS